MEYTAITNQKELKNNKNKFYYWYYLEIMTLDNEFIKQTNKLVTETLKLYQDAGASPRIGEVWRCENTGDFLCGFFVGEMVGSALSAFQVFHKREPTPQEHMEIVEIVENYSKAITEFFSQFNNWSYILIILKYYFYLTEIWRKHPYGHTV